MSKKKIDTGGGAYVGDHARVEVSGGDFVGRDQVKVTGLGPDEIAARFQALYAAVENRPDTPPEDKADLIADTLNIEVTGVLYVSESSYTPYTATRSYAVAEAGMDAPTPIIEGSLSVSVNVQVSFTFQ